MMQLIVDVGSSLLVVGSVERPVGTSSVVGSVDTSALVVESDELMGSSDAAVELPKSKVASDELALVVGRSVDIELKWAVIVNKCFNRFARAG